MGSSHGCTFAVAASFKSPQPQLVLFDAAGHREVAIPRVAAELGGWIED